MPLDFRDAAKRHWKDAEYLLEDERFANADHLFGMSAECALKAVMLSLGMQMVGNMPEKTYAKHINLLWDLFGTFANSRNGARYALQISGTPNPFSNWTVNQRYDSRTDFTPGVVEDHRTAARMAKQVLESAIINGDIT